MPQPTAAEIRAALLYHAVSQAARLPDDVRATPEAQEYLRSILAADPAEVAGHLPKENPAAPGNS